MYYTIVLVIAVILLIVALVFVGMMLTRGRNYPFPEYQAVCPDFWLVDGSMCRPPPGGYNTPSPDKFSGTSPSIVHTGVVVRGNTVVSLDTSPAQWSGLCSKSAWAKMNGIFWDGVANTNQCS